MPDQPDTPYVATAEYAVREAMNRWYRDDVVKPHGRQDPSLVDAVVDGLIHDPAALADLVKRSAAAFRRTPLEIIGLGLPGGSVIVTPRQPVSMRDADEYNEFRLRGSDDWQNW